MNVDLSKPIQFGGKLWKCSSAVAKTRSVFRVDEAWYYCEDKIIRNETQNLLPDVFVAAYEKMETKNIETSTEFCYVGDELEKLRKDRHKTKGDRHIPTPKRL